MSFPPVPVCPHAGGVGLCELVQHLILFDYICVSGSLSSRYEQDPFLSPLEALDFTLISTLQSAPVCFYSTLFQNV